MAVKTVVVFGRETFAIDVSRFRRSEKVAQFDGDERPRCAVGQLIGFEWVS